MAAATLSPQETEARAHLRELEYPRLVSHSNGRQTRVANVQEAEAALAKGATLVPTEVSPDDGGTPNKLQITIVQQALVAGGGSDLPAPSVTKLVPDTAVLGSPDFDLHVMGAGFVKGATIVFAGQDEPTDFQSETELTTGVNMSVWMGPDPAIQVSVRNLDGQISNTVSFAFTTTARSAPDTTWRK